MDKNVIYIHIYISHYITFLGHLHAELLFLTLWPPEKSVLLNEQKNV